MDKLLLLRQMRGFIEADPHPLPVLSNCAALLMSRLPDLNWAGFYLMEGGSLMLGPFQGEPACIRIPVGKGVCGTAVRENAAQLVKDVHAFPGHIACDSRSNSELVIPIRRGDAVIGVLDLDSPTPGRFTAEDLEALSELVQLLETDTAWDRWQL